MERPTIPENPGALRQFIELALGDDVMGLDAELAHVEDRAGDRMGRYELVELLGDGGFGVVWLARQTEPVTREVALKLLKPGMDSREIVRRFSAERQTLARLDHPHIATFFEAGATESGRLYFVMERIVGERITLYCDRHQMTVDRRVELFLQVCDAVQHAHRRALVHRDLKPSNILVTEAGGRALVKVIDFGVAKALGRGEGGFAGERALSTVVGRVVGTPLYMSPEQAEGRPDIDTRSDLYSLGVLLYELLTGTTPITAESLSDGSAESTLRRIREEPPRDLGAHFRRGTSLAEAVALQRGSTVPRLARALRGELNWILQRALEKDPERRYGSVDELAADLRRYLNHEPVLVGPPSRWYRTSKLIRRHRGALLTGGGVLMSLVLGLALASWQAVRATRAERIAKSRLVMAEQARDAAEELLSDTVLANRDRVVPYGKKTLIGDSIDAASRYFAKLPEGLSNEQTEEHALRLDYNRGILAMMEGRLEDGGQFMDRALAGMVKLEQRGPLNEDLMKESIHAALIGAQTYSMVKKWDEAARFRKVARERAERWLQEHPDSLWALASMSHEAAMAVLERVMYARDAAGALPHFLRVKTYETKLAQRDDRSVEYYQAKGTTLYCEAFASMRTGRGDLQVVTLFESAAAAFSLAYEGAETALFRTMYLDLQLEAETWAGPYLVRHASAHGGSEHLERGRDFILSAFARRQEQARWDPYRVESWMDLAASCREIMHLVAVTPEEEEAARLVSIVITTASAVAENAKNYKPATSVMSEALCMALAWRSDRRAEWDEEALAAMTTIFDLSWQRAASAVPEVADFRELGNSLSLFHRWLRRSDKQARASALAACAALMKKWEQAETGEIEVTASLVRSILMLKVSSLMMVSPEYEEGEIANVLAVVPHGVAQLWEELDRGGETQANGVVLLDMLGSEVHLWLELQPAARRAASAEQLQLALKGALARLVQEAEWRPERIENHAMAWAANGMAARLQWGVHGADSGEIEVDELSRYFRQVVRVADDPLKKKWVVDTIYDAHLRMLRRHVGELDVLRQDEAAVAVLDELLWVFSCGVGNLSASHYERTALMHMNRAVHLLPMGRHGAAHESIVKAEEAIQMLAQLASQRASLPTYRHMNAVLGVAYAYANHHGSATEHEWSALAGVLQQDAPKSSVLLEAILIDRAWGCFYEMAADNASDHSRELIRKEWQNVRAQTIAGKAKHASLRRLRTIPAAE